MEERGDRVYLHLLRSMTNFVAMLDTDGRFEFTNRPTFGYTDEDLRGKRIWESQLFNRSEEYQKVAKDVCEKALQGDKTRAYTTAFNKNGVALPIVLEMAPLKDDQGTVIGAVAEGKSISGWRRLEAKLKETVEKLKASQEELSTPITQIWEHILVLPIIGVLDSHRAQNMMETLLTKIMETQSEVVILDVTGVASIDTEVASHIMKTVQATSLLGARCVLTGIRPEVAQTVVHLGLDLEKFVTKRDLQEGLKFGLEQIGYEIRRKDSYIED